ncbi:MAG: hypothetical protein L0338_35075 [Acidobacteria bacterium]|nr:hypothetical protein [Acidobacteriota bacterium]
MSYRKPEVEVLGDATRVIESLQIKNVDVQTDPRTSESDFSPAYDLDE